MKAEILDVEFKKEAGKEGVVILTTEVNTFVEAAKKEGIEKATLEKVAALEDEYLKASLGKAKDLAVKEFKDNKVTKEVIVKVPFGTNKSDIVTHDIVREKTYPIPGKNESVTKSVIKTQVTKKGTKLSKSSIKALETEIYELINK